MMFDTSPAANPSGPRAALTHLPLSLVVLGAVGVFAGLHLASATLAVLAGGHLVLGAVLAAARALLRRGEVAP